MKQIKQLKLFSGKIRPLYASNQQKIVPTCFKWNKLEQNQCFFGPFQGRQAVFYTVNDTLYLLLEVFRVVVVFFFDVEVVFFFVVVFDDVVVAAFGA